jgi:mono/diheme cytochrome c family protein
MQARQIRALGWASGLCAVFLLMGAVLERPKERDIRIPRVPPEQLEQARAVTNPFSSTEEIRKQGKGLFKMACVACHGPEGKGDGPVAQKSKMDPKPRNFTNPEFQRLRSDGELFWVLKHGSHNTEMMRMDFFFTDEELWKLIIYIRTLGQATP